MGTSDQSWQPTDEQMQLEIAPAYEEVRDRLQKLQAATGCPDSYIRVLLEFIASSYFGPPTGWSPPEADGEA